MWILPSTFSAKRYRPMFVPANPHAKIVLEISDEKRTRDVEFEGRSRNRYYRAVIGRRHAIRPHRSKALNASERWESLLCPPT